jgi:hypothetical protein
MAVLDTLITFVPTIFDFSHELKTQFTGDFESGNLNFPGWQARGTVKLLNADKTVIFESDLLQKSTAIDSIVSSTITSKWIHGYLTGEPVNWIATVPIEGIVSGVCYYVIVLNETQFRVAATREDAINGVYIHLGVYTGVSDSFSTIYTDSRLAIKDQKTKQDTYYVVWEIWGMNTPNDTYTRTQQVNVTYSLPIPKLDKSYSTVAGNTQYPGYQSVADLRINPTDPTAIIYFDAAGITNPGEQISVEELFNNTRGGGNTPNKTNFYSKIKCLYLVSPTGQAAASVNAINPGTNDIIWGGFPVFDANGVTGNGIDAYGDTGFDPSGLLISELSLTASVYNNPGVDGNDIGCVGDSGGTDVYCTLNVSNVNTGVFGQLGHAQVSYPAGYTQTGIRTLQTNPTRLDLWQDGVIVASGGDLNGLPDAFAALDIALMARNANGIIGQFSTRGYDCFAITENLTDEEVEDLHWTIAEYRATVNIPYEYDIKVGPTWVESAIYLAFQDQTPYDTLGGYTLEDFNRHMSLFYPNNLGVLTEDDLDYMVTSGFYGGSPATHDIKIDYNAFYQVPFIMRYTDVEPIEMLPGYLFLQGWINDHIDVYADSKGCGVYTCLTNMYKGVMKSIGTTHYTKKYNDFQTAVALGQLIVSAFDCGRNNDVNELMEQFKQLTNCDCNDCDGEIGSVYAIGTSPSITRRGGGTIPIDGQFYQSDSLKGLSFEGGDFALTLNGDFADSLVFDTLTGIVTSTGPGFLAGDMISWELLRP